MNVIIVDDELNARLALQGILKEHFTDVFVVDMCKDVPEAVQSIYKHNPDIVFLDISMPGYSGLELVQFFSENVQFKIIFVTAYSEFAINAFELSAIDYILKPVKITALQRALGKFSERSCNLEILKENLKLDKPQKLALQTGEGINFLNLNDILYLKADGSYTHFVTTASKRITVSKRISEYERLEKLGSFIRIHRSHIINYNCIQKILKQDGGIVVMANGDTLSISNEKKQALLDLFSNSRL